MATLFVADLHLSPARPEVVRLFLEFLSNTASRAEALYILGDLFEYWAGDDELAEGFNAGIVAALSRCARSGNLLYFMRGNRDFLIGSRFAQAAGLTLIEDPALIGLYGQPTLLTHGDDLCTDDAPYQNFRRQVRAQNWIDGFLARPLAERKREIEALRVLSEAEKRRKPAAAMDVNADAVADLLRRHGYPHLIHGHTHRPAHQEHDVDGRRCERWVLPDWYESGGVLVAERSGIRIEHVLGER
jgi:UDP-2,3-diacylglucosamine hydrolase